MLLAGVPDLVRAIVIDALNGAPDVRIVGEVDSLGDSVEAAGEVDVVIATQEGERLPGDALELLYANGRLAILGIALASGDAHLWYLRPDCTVYADASPQDLVAALRLAAPSARATREGAA